MTDETDEIASPDLAGFLHSTGLIAFARVIAIDQDLARQIESDNPDADGCASLVLEAADLIANAGSLGLDWSGWDEDEFVGSDGWDGDFAERMFDVAARAGGDSDWGEDGIE